jgi:hypothetical protein
MPIDSALILSGIVLAFIAFAATLMWSDFQTRSLKK